ncbi:hypothetical protein TanjilG_29592 [Lupinus angustifolius]|uniref:RING-type domain-containing protein n=1 Tax=Lupinus angustifolius TaxID=3871 RepID=A0A4P1R633_LUPAN|nr:PREDICTED: uncharacterized protein LOC109360548 [Lupinus angustifolius]OIW02816.1 hypothetical protein TanjilG_29592 [Lupinus angustifolius]
MSSLEEIHDQQQLLLIHDLHDLSLKPQSEMAARECEKQHEGICAICLDKIVLQEMALVKGCEHAYCVTCILRWATYRQNATCPQCKHPFEFLNVHRSLDGSIHDYMFEESLCLLLRAPWFKPLVVEDHVHHEDVYDDDIGNYYQYEYGFDYEDDDEDLDEVYFGGSASLRIGNRRWGDNGYVRAGRLEARPAYRTNFQESGAGSSRGAKKKAARKSTTNLQESGSSSSREPKKKEAVESATNLQESGASSSCEPKKKEAAESTTGRRAKRALKREAADIAAAAKHQQHLVRLGRK